MSTDTDTGNADTVEIDNAERCGATVNVRLSPVCEADGSGTTEKLDLRIHCGPLEVSIRLNDSEVQEIRQLLEAA